jgi:hypothetical protein
MAEDDKAPTKTIPAPTEPGFYRYSGGNQNMIFLLRADGQWWVWFDTSEVHKCEWGYIEQALGVWELWEIGGIDEAAGGGGW